MDPAAKASTRELIVGLRDAGVTVLLTTHELHDVELLADRIAIIDRGRIVAAGTRRRAGGRRVPAPPVPDRLDPRAADRAGKLEVRTGSLARDDAVGRYVLDGRHPNPTAVAELATWFATRDILVAELRTTGATLEERYLELTGERSRRW